jgi:hypothetical protein
MGKLVVFSAVLTAALTGGATGLGCAHGENRTRGLHARAHADAPRPLWSDGFESGGFGVWDALDGNTSTAELRRRYFSVSPDPAGGRGHAFKATVDGAARGGNEAGQRSLLELFPRVAPRSKAVTGAVQGQERWYHARVYFPRGFVPAKKSDWNWVIEWHTWPDGPCCENLELTVDTDPSRGSGERFVLRSEGGGTPSYPVERYPAYPARNPTTHDDHFVGDPHLKRNHWYVVLLHVIWDYRPRHGLVEWWLDGRRVISRRTSTLYWYNDANSDQDGQQPGPGQAYLMAGYYRDSRLLNGSIDDSVMSVYHDDYRIGISRASVR